MKKFWNRLVVLILSITMGFSFPVFAEENTEEKVNYIQNGSFEELDESGKLVGWRPMGGDWETAAASFTEETAYEGKHSLRIANSGQHSNPWAATTIYGLTEGGLYEISSKIKTERFAGDAYTAFKMEAYDAEGGNFFGEEVTEAFSMDTVNQWLDISGTFTVPEGTEYIVIYARLYATIGTVYFDNVQLTMADPPDKYLFNVNTKIQYDDTETGSATLGVHSFYEGQGVGAETAVDFSLVDTVTGEVVDSKSFATMPEDIVTYTFSLEKMTELKREYEVRASAKDKTGNVVGEYSDIIAKFKRPARLTKDGQYIVNGEVFHPCIGYHVEPRDYPRMAEIGINVVQMSGSTGTVEAALAEAAKYGMMGLIMMYADGRSGGHPDNLEHTKTMIEVIKDNENVFAVIPMDEPFIVSYTQETKDELWNYYKAVRSVDDDVPVYIVDANVQYFYEDVKFCDIFYSENYTAGTKASKMVMEQGESARNADKFYGVLGGVHKTGFRPFQTGDQLRDTFYRSFAEGTNGIGYYAISDADHDTGTPLYRAAPETWEGLSAFTENEQTELFDYYAGKKYETFGRYYPRPADAMGSYAEAWVKDGGIMLAVHNHSQEEKSIELPLTSSNGLVSIGAFTATPIGGATEEISGNGIFSITLPANQAVLYKVTPSTAVDFSSVSQNTGNKNHFVPIGSEETVPEVTEKPTGLFGDLAGYEWASEQIQELYEKGVIDDKNIYAFAPGENITRVDFVTFLARALGLTGGSEAFPDCDVPEVLAAKEAGVVKGDTDGNFRPTDPITRQDVFTIAARSVRVSDLSDTSETEEMFADWNQVSEYARGSIAAMVKAGVVQGNGDGTMNPMGFTTRAETAVFLHRLQNTDFSMLQEGTQTEIPEETPEEITFTDTVNEETLQKWNNAADLIKSVGIGEIAVESSITKGGFEALIQNLTGVEYSAFSEDYKALKYAETVEALVKLLGYEVYTVRDGGYLGVASRIDLTKGVTPTGEYIRGGELALLLQNAIDIYLCEETSFGTGAAGTYAVKDETLLSAYKNIYRYDGIVSDNYETADDLKKDEIRIDTDIFYGEGAGEYIGQRVAVYAEVDGDAKKVCHIAPRKSVTVTEIDAEDISPEKTTTGTFTWEDKTHKEKTASITGATLIKNGRKKANWTKTDITPASGSVTLISNDGSSVDTILVWAYENRIIDKIYASENQIIFKEGKPLTVDLEDTEMKQTVVRANGQPVTLAAMSEYHVLSVAESEDGTVRRIIFANSTVSGNVTEVSDKTVTIEETEYEIAENLRTSTVLPKPELGQSAKYCLDYSGKIAAVNTTVTGRNYGYFTTAALGKGLNAKIKFRIFTKEGTMGYFEGAEKIIFNGEPASKDEIMNSSILFSGDTPIGQLVVYETNEAGKLTEITTAKDKRLVPFKDQGGNEEFSIVASPSGTTGETNVLYYKLGAKYRFNSGTLIFQVPSVYSENDADYGIGNNNIVFTHSTNIGASKYYDLSHDYYLSAIVNESTPSTVTEKSSPYGVVTGYVNVLDDEGGVSSGVRVVNNRGEEQTLIFPSSEFRINFGDVTLTNIAKDEAKTSSGGRPLNITPSQLNPGDVIQWELDPMTDKVSAMLCVFRYKSMPAAGTVWPASLAGNGGKHDNYGQQFFGYFKTDRVFELGFVTSKPHEWLFNFWSVNTRYAVLAYEKDTGKCYKIDYEDVREGETIMYACWAYMMQLGVVYR